MDTFKLTWYLDGHFQLRGACSEIFGKVIFFKLTEYGHF